MSSRRYGGREADPIGNHLADQFIQNRNQQRVSSDNGVRGEYDGEEEVKKSTFESQTQAPKDMWAGGGDHLSTNKLSLMLNDMQVIIHFKHFKNAQTFGVLCVSQRLKLELDDIVLQFANLNLNFEIS